jgi:hypothetical protein
MPAEPLDVVTAQAPVSPPASPFLMLGDDDGGLCVDGVCAVPTAGVERP